MCKNRIRHVYWAAFSLFAVCSDSCGRTGTVSVLHLMRWGGIHWKLIFKAQLKHHGFVREMMMMMMVMMMTMLIMMMAMETVVMVLLLLLLRMRYTQMTAMTTMIMGTTTTMKTMKKTTTTMIMTMIMTVTIMMTMATKQWVRYFADGTLGGIDLSVLQVVAVCQVLHLTQASAEPVSV